MSSQTGSGSSFAAGEKEKIKDREEYEALTQGHLIEDEQESAPWDDYTPEDDPKIEQYQTEEPLQKLNAQAGVAPLEGASRLQCLWCWKHVLKTNCALKNQQASLEFASTVLNDLIFFCSVSIGRSLEKNCVDDAEQEQMGYPSLELSEPNSGRRFRQQATFDERQLKEVDSEDDWEDLDEGGDNLGTDQRKKRLMSKLEDDGILLDKIIPGTIRMLCPECQGGSTSEKSFAVTIRPDFMVRNANIAQPATCTRFNLEWNCEITIIVNRLCSFCCSNRIS